MAKTVIFGLFFHRKLVFYIDAKGHVNLREQLPVSISLYQHSAPHGCINHARNHTSAAPLPLRVGHRMAEG
jgi:hypothetical protein